MAWHGMASVLGKCSDHSFAWGRSSHLAWKECFWPRCSCKE
jgi:hypothetical protein